MRARVSSCTSGDWLMTRETVFFDTLASRAMSLMVALRPGRMLEDRVAAERAAAELRSGVRVAFFRRRVMARRFYGNARRRAGCPLSRRGYVTGVMGMGTQRRVPTPAKGASA